MTHPKETSVATKLVYYAIISLIPLALGFGVYPLLALVLIAVIVCLLLIGSKPFLENFKILLSQRGYRALLLFLGLFLASYRGFYIPYHPEIFKMPWGYFGVLSALSAFTILWVGFFENSKDHIRFIWYCCLGTLLLGLGTAGAALILQPPPYYGNVIDIRYLPFGLIKYINTPGISNLLCFFPILFLAGILLNPDQRPKWFWVMGVFGYVLSLGAAVALGQRSYFVLTLIIQPMIVAFFFLFLQTWRPFMAICALLINYPLLRFTDEAVGTGVIYRPLDQNLFTDGRFQMFRFWFEHLISNPFKRVNVGPAPWDSYAWFHNFFADIHRLSGFWALLAAAILMAFIFYRIICVIKLDRRFGLFLMAMAFPCFLIMNTSVVPEGERQPFLLLLAIGAIAEVTISREKRRLKMNTSNPLPDPH